MFVLSVTAAILSISSVYAQSGVSLGAFKDNQCSDPYGINYTNQLDPNANMTGAQFDQCQPNALAYGKLTKLTKPVTMNDFPNINGKAKVVTAAWKNPNCQGDPFLLTVIYQDSPTMQVKCTTKTLTVTSMGNQTKSEGSGVCQTAASSSGMFKCLMPDSSAANDRVSSWTGVVVAGALSLLML